MVSVMSSWHGSSPWARNSPFTQTIQHNIKTHPTQISLYNSYLNVNWNNITWDSWLLSWWYIWSYVCFLHSARINTVKTYKTQNPQHIKLFLYCSVLYDNSAMINRLIQLCCRIHFSERNQFHRADLTALALFHGCAIITTLLSAECTAAL